MLGLVRRNTRLDIGLVLSFGGTAYLVWALVAGVSRAVVQEMIRSTDANQLPALSHAVRVFFVDIGFVIDVVGLSWLALSMVLVVLASRQRIRAAWAWISAIGQSSVAALGAVLVSWATYQPHMLPPEQASAGTSLGEQVSAVSLPLVVVLAVLLWVTVLFWLLVERARLNRRGPTLSDGLRTQTYR